MLFLNTNVMTIWAVFFTDEVKYYILSLLYYQSWHIFKYISSLSCIKLLHCFLYCDSTLSVLGRLYIWRRYYHKSMQVLNFESFITFLSTPTIWYPDRRWIRVCSSVKILFVIIRRNHEINQNEVLQFEFKVLNFKVNGLRYKIVRFDNYLHFFKFLSLYVIFVRVVAFFFADFIDLKIDVAIKHPVKFRI